MFLFSNRERKASRNGALRTLDFAMTGIEGKDNCQKIVDILGLRTIFPLFMKPPKGNKRSGETRTENEGSTVHIEFYFYLIEFFRTCYIVYCFVNKKLYWFKSSTCIK